MAERNNNENQKEVSENEKKPSFLKRFFGFWFNVLTFGFFRKKREKGIEELNEDLGLDLPEPFIEKVSSEEIAKAQGQSEEKTAIKQEVEKKTEEEPEKAQEQGQQME